MNSTIEMELTFTHGVASFKPKNLPNWYGIENVGFIWHGAWSDPEIEYKGKRINATIVEDTMWERFREECQSEDIDDFSNYMKEQAEEVYKLIDLAMGV